MSNKTSSIPIFLASDDNYAPFVATTIVSIVKNTSAFVDFYVLDGGITESNKQKITSLKNKFNNFSIEFLDMSKSGLERFPNIKHYSLNTFSRYFIPKMKPELDKVLYMDVDIIVNGDISELYKQDLGNYPLGAVLEDFYSENYSYLQKTFPEYKGGSNYFNAGVLLFSLNYFRENNLTEHFVEKTVEHKNILNCPDQDIFNLIFQNNFKILDYKYNYMPDHEHLIKSLDKPQALEAINNPLVLHFTGVKPWKDLTAKKVELFWNSAIETPYYDELKKDLLKTEKKKKIKLYKKMIKSFILSKLLLKSLKNKYKIKFEEIKSALEVSNKVKKELF